MSCILDKMKDEAPYNYDLLQQFVDACREKREKVGKRERGEKFCKHLSLLMIDWKTEIICPDCKKPVMFDEIIKVKYDRVYH